jgi:hypothetical protein
MSGRFFENVRRSASRGDRGNREQGILKMSKDKTPNSRQLRRLKRLAEHDALAKEARFWKNVPTGLPSIYHNNPVNTQAGRGTKTRKRRK